MGVKRPHFALGANTSRRKRVIETDIINSNSRLDDFKVVPLGLGRRGIKGSTLTSVPISSGV